MKKQSKENREFMKDYKKLLSTRYKEPINPMKTFIILIGLLFNIWGLIVSDELKVIGGFALLLLGAMAK